MSPMVIAKVQKLRNLTMVILIKKNSQIFQWDPGHNSNKLIRFIARDMGVSKFLIKQVVYEDIQYEKRPIFYHRL